MERWQRRAAKTVGGLVVVVFVSSLLYHYVMVAVEGREPAYLHSTQVVVETFTGTGYGSDSPWETPLGNLFVIGLDLSTFLVLFIVLPYVFQPILEESLSPTVPRSIELADHVVVCGYTARVERLVDEFEARGVDYVVIVEDRDEAVTLQETDVSIIHGDPSSATALEGACVEAASSVVVDTRDEDAASTVLAVRERNETVTTNVLCTDLSLERPLTYAGADAVMTPRHMLAQRIAERVRAELNPRLSDVICIGEDFAFVEATVSEDSPLCGTTIEGSGILENPDVTVVGLWADGEFHTSPPPETEIDEDVTLLIAGSEAELRAVETRTRDDSGSAGPVVVAGHGEVGSTVSKRLREAGLECTVVDLEDDPDVDVVGDATDEDVLREAGLESAAVFVVAIARDEEAVLSVLIAREVGDDLGVLVRVNDSANEAKARRAGADYVLSLPDISARLLALDVLKEEILSYDRQLKVVRYESPALVGRSVGDLPLADLDCFLIGVERDDEVRTDVPPTFTFEEDDSLLLAGDDEAVDALESVLD